VGGYTPALRLGLEIIERLGLGGYLRTSMPVPVSFAGVPVASSADIVDTPLFRGGIL
jgi:hypothetical protein